MAATYSKPTGIPRWADTSGNVLEPSSAKKDEGWLYEEVPPSSYENWRTREVGRWFKWLNERLFDGTSADAFVIKQPGDAQEMFRLEGDWVYLNEGNLELTENDVSSDGGMLRFRNTLRTTEDDAVWRIRQLGGTDSGLRFEVGNLAGTDEFNPVSIFRHINTITSYPAMIFDQDVSLVPLGGGNSSLGFDNYRWFSEYVDNFYQTNKAYMFAADILATPITITGGAIITPTTVRMSALMATTATPSRRITFSRNGVYRVHFSATWRATAANSTCVFDIKENGTLILGTRILDHADGNADIYTSHTHALVLVTNPATDYIEFYGSNLVGEGGNGSAEVAGTIATIEIIKEDVIT